MNEPSRKKTAVVTGASSGIGAATARALAAAGFEVFLGARRHDKLEEVARSIGGNAQPLDVTSEDSVESFVTQCPKAIDLLVNNAGGALGLEPIEDSDDQDWRTMWEVNVLGVARMTRAILPALRRAPDAHVIVVGSIAGFETYSGGAGYTAAKHGVRAVTRTLRLELLGEPIRVTEVCPGLAETEFSLVRFKGDSERADAVYRGLEPLTGDDVADCIVWATTRPPHVNIDEIVVRPRDQATATAIHRRDD
ncbi:MAG: SDR family NAD(P)-dependent oxidoreductase [Acidobacteriota bacterium]|nr:SDR family NAD(P)-dependent oxidoreductase [Acidobacteriota bacterium]